MEFLLKHTRGIIALTLGTDKLNLWLDIFFSWGFVLQMSSRNKTNASTSRRKSTTSSSAPTHDANRFLSAVKEEYYEKILADLKCVPVSQSASVRTCPV